MKESRDSSRTSHIDWAGAALAVLGLGGIVPGLLEWPPLGVMMARTFDARVRPSLDRLMLTSSERTAIGRELPKMAGAELTNVESIESRTRSEVRDAIDRAFVSAFGLVMLGAAVLAPAA
jgi:hypothetical protein